jgi:hypothetical protein
MVFVVTIVPADGSEPFRWSVKAKTKAAARRQAVLRWPRPEYRVGPVECV